MQCVALSACLCVSASLKRWQNVIRSSKETKQCALIKFGNVSSSDMQTTSINLKRTHAQPSEQRESKLHLFWHRILRKMAELLLENTNKMNVLIVLETKCFYFPPRFEICRTKNFDLKH